MVGLRKLSWVLHMARIYNQPYVKDILLIGYVKDILNS